MKLTNNLVALLLVPLTLFTTSATAWKVLFEGDDGRHTEQNGIWGLGRCREIQQIPALKLSTITFDPTTKAWWDPTAIYVYDNKCCDDGDVGQRVFAGVNKVDHYELDVPRRAKSFMIR